MRKHSLALAVFMIAALSGTAFAGAGNFTLVNGTGVGFSAVSIKRTGTNSWQQLSGAPAAGAASNIVFSDPDCAFDLRATLASGGSAEWAGVNLCGTSRLTLQRRASGETWVDYD